MLTQEELNRLFIYDPESGHLVWRRREQSDFKAERDWRAWNSNNAGSVAGSPNNFGHIRVRYNNKFYLAHRLIWKMVNGEDPEIIDHINGNPADNRIENLRSASIFSNMRNVRTRSERKGRCFGVFRIGRRWVVRIGEEGKQVQIGTFTRLHEAIAIRKCAEIVRGYHPLHGQPAYFSKAEPK